MPRYGVLGGGQSGPRSEPGGQNTPRAGRFVGVTSALTTLERLHQQVSPDTPLVRDLSDDFDTGTTPDAAKWVDVGATASALSGGRLRLVNASGATAYVVVRSREAFSLVGNAMYVKVPTVTCVASSSHEVAFEFADASNPSTKLMFDIGGTNLGYGLSSAMTYGRAYDPTGDAWWRMSESAGTVTFATSPDGTTWTTLGTAPTPPFAAAGLVVFEVGHYNTEAAATVAEFDSFNVVAGTVSGTAADTVAVSDVAARGLTAPRGALDTVGVSDTATRGLRAFTAAAADTVTVGADSASRLRAGPRTATDTVTVSDSAARAAPAIRGAADSVSVTDNVSAVSAGAPTASASDTVIVSDAAMRVVARTRPTGDTVAVSDSAARTGSRTRGATDGIAVSDSATRTSGRARGASDNVTVSDQAARGQAWARAGSDVVSVFDSADRAGTRSRAASDLVLISDGTQRTLTRRAAATDTITVLDDAGAVVTGGVIVVLNDADDIYLGATPIDAVYVIAGVARVWG